MTATAPEQPPDLPDARGSLASSASDEAPLMRLTAVSRTYGRGRAAFRALHDIHLVIKAGEFVAIMGPSGSGKSTLMNIFGCLDSPTSGSYEFMGVPVERLTRDQRALLRRARLGFVFQGFHLLPRTSALENVELPLIYCRQPLAVRREAARGALAVVGLAGWEDHLPSELSGGQQQRVAIARAIVTRPTVLLADEPTGNLDTRTGGEVMGLLERLNRETGLTILMVTHELEMAMHAHRVVRVVDGELESDTTTGARAVAAHEHVP